ncbi:hypothetical protein [Streptomyces milbemycinicus]|uniref:Uncharacterized protein n=1 Tax=Streptomyces milbemycinicus TaxID=476552 RepID=A0ABW8LJQ1_9ACTN
MTNNGQVALAFTSGYLLGRGHRMRSALALAGLTAGRRLVSGRGVPGPVPGAPSELGKLGHEVRDQLVAAGRSAAMSAASHRIDALSDRLEHRAEALRHGSDGHKGAEETKADEAKEGKEAKAKETKAAKETEEPEKAKGTRESDEARRKRTTDRPERPRKRVGAGGSERRGRG